MWKFELMKSGGNRAGDGQQAICDGYIYADVKEKAPCYGELYRILTAENRTVSLK